MLGLSNFAVGVFALWRISVKEAIPIEEQVVTVSLPQPMPDRCKRCYQDGEVPEWERDGENFE